MEPQKIILTPFSGLWLLVDIDRDATTGWEGYDYLVNGDADGTLWLAKNGGGWQWAKRTKLDCRIAGRELHLAIPREALGLPTDTAAASFDFKWADNIQKPGEIMDFYLSGDVAPEGRFNYRYASPSE